MKKMIIGLMLFLFASTVFAANAVVGSVDTSFNMLGANDSIKIVRLNDPDIANVHCYMASAIAGGISGSLGIAEDKSEYDLSCYTTGPVSVPDDLPEGAQVAMERRSAFFKKLHIVRFIDREHRRLIYMAYTTWLVDGSPKHSMYSIPY